MNFIRYFCTSLLLMLKINFFKKIILMYFQVKNTLKTTVASKKLIQRKIKSKLLGDVPRHDLYYFVTYFFLNKRFFNLKFK